MIPANSDPQTHQALAQRPQLSIRTRVVIAFLVLFALQCAMTIAAILFMLSIEAKIEFLEKVGNYSFEIQQARRFEKNYFLYKTNLADALINTNNARNLLKRNINQIKKIIGDTKYAEMTKNLDRYEGLLEKLLKGVDSKTQPLTDLNGVEVQLRKFGGQILNDAHDMIDQERLSVRSMLSTSLLAVVSFLGLMFFVMFYAGGLIIRSVLSPLKRFLKYTARIGSGDYTPITPTRKYRDEFSTLAIAINEMLHEISTRQEQLMQSGKMTAVGTLTSGIAHELNNPLNNIGLTVEALLDSFEDYSDEEKQKMLRQVYTQVERASGTIRNLLDFTRKEQPSFTSVNMNDAIESTLRLIANELKIQGVGLEVQVPGDLPRVRGNPRNIQQVLLNLFLNSIQAMDAGGKLTVVAEVEGNEFVRVDVIDTGKGISPENIKNIFDPFFTTKDPGQGTGLGLSVSKSIVDKHGGKITVSSEEGVGTTFSTFWLLDKKN